MIKTRLALKTLANRLKYLLASFLVFRSLGWCELVQDKRRKFSPPRMPLAPSIRMLHTRYLLSYWPPWTVEEGDMATFFSWPRIGASGENVSAPATGHQKGQKWSGELFSPTHSATGHQKGQEWSGVSIEKIYQVYLFHFCFLNEATAGAPRHACKTFYANIRRSDLRMFSIR